MTDLLLHPGARVSRDVLPSAWNVMFQGIAIAILAERWATPCDEIQALIATAGYDALRVVRPSINAR